MAYIKVDPNKLQSISSSIRQISWQTGSISSTVSGVRRNLDWDVACENDIDRKLRDIVGRLEDVKARMNTYSDFLGEAGRKYYLTEYRDNSKTAVARAGILGISSDVLYGLQLRMFEPPKELNPKRFDPIRYVDILSDVIRNRFNNTVDKLVKFYGIASDMQKKFKECLRTGITEIAGFIYNGVKTGAKAVKNGISNCVSAVVDSYKSKGAVFRIVRGVCAVADIAFGTATVICSVLGTGVSAGLGAPAAILIGTYGSNMAISGFSDLVNCITGNVDMVGEVNPLKTASAWTFGQVGSWFGNKKFGESFGEAVYTVGGLASAVVSIKNIAGQIKQSATYANTLDKSVKTAEKIITDAKQEIPKAIDGIKYIVTNCKLSEMRYNVTLLSKELPNITSAISEIGLVKKGVEGCKKLIEGGMKVINSFAGWEMFKKPTLIPDEVTDFIGAPDSVEDGVESLSESMKLIKIEL